jgi:hypothetical protein
MESVNCAIQNHKSLNYEIRFLPLPKNMVPDYPHKTFGDKRICYCLLMEALAMDSID